MSSEDRLTDPVPNGQPATVSSPPAPPDMSRDGFAVEVRSQGPGARSSTDVRKLPAKLIDAWSRWAASRLS
jgi:hypothetical protein